MTDIDTMSLDELRIAVAREVMGWQDVTTRRTADGTLTGVLVTDDGRRVIDDIPDYPRDITAAWLVFTHFETMHKGIWHTQRRSNGWTLGQPLEWHCTIGATNTVTATSAPEAICRAALKAIRK